jgi:hypothetical protein
MTSGAKKRMHELPPATMLREKCNPTYGVPSSMFQITPTLQAAIEAAAAVEGKSVNAWVIDLLEGAVTHAQEIAGRRRASEQERKQAEARAEKWLQEKLERLGQFQTQTAPEGAAGRDGAVYLRALRGAPRAA